MIPGRKLVLGGLLVAAVTAYMAYQGASSSWQYYLTAEECLAQADALAGTRVRVSGRVAAGSLKTAGDRGQAVFALEGTGRNLPVVCAAPAPDNLAEELQVVVEGTLDQAGVLRAEKVLTRCASKYASRGGGPGER